MSRDLRLGPRIAFGHKRLTRRELMTAAAATGAGLLVAGAHLPSAVSAQDATPSNVSGDITYWHHFTSESEMTGLDHAIASFEQKYPNVKITQEDIPNADFMAKFTSAVQSGSRPNTSMVTTDRVQDMVAMGGLVDLTDRINGWADKKNFPDSVWPGCTVDGKLYGVPAFMFVNWLYYRVDWFQEAGIAKPPDTLQEFRDAAIKLTDPSKKRFGFGLRGGDGGEGYLLDVIRSYGVDFVDADGKVVMDKGKATEAVAFYAGLFTTDKVSPPSAPSDSYQQVMNALETGQTGMVLHHTGSLTEVTNALGDKIMTAPVPAGPVRRIASVSPLFNGLMKNDDADAAWAWITHWGDPDVEITFLKDTGYFPPNTAAANDERVTGNPLYAAASKTLSFGVLPPQFPGYPGWSKQTVLPAFQQVLVGKATPEQAVDQMITGLKQAVS
jgi:multiple sugar transport system substrate-binding protein